VFILDAASGRVTAVSSDHESLGPASWSLAGDRLAFFSTPTGLAIASKDGSNIHSLAVAENTQLYDPEWAPSGGRIYVDTDSAGI
jgi:hypothetical protein